MSEQDTSEEVQVASKQPTNTGRDPSEPAASSNKSDGKSTLLVILGAIMVISWVIYVCTGTEWNNPEIHWFPISLMLTIIFAVILFLWKKLWIFKNISQFNSWIFGVTLIGGTIAFLLPLGISNDFAKDGAGTTLRQMLIYTTGGLLGVITLSETRRKNDEEMKKNRQDKQKNKKDHIRQVHAERRNRYTKAIEQLADEKAAIRLGGIYTLVGLVDEWLADKSIKYENDQRKEGQVIINNLCSYIRSPFPLAEKRETLSSLPHKSIYVGDFIADKAKFAGEQEVRHAIFAEISKRLTNKENKMIYRLWDKFEYDFSKAPIFYSLKNMTFRNPDFSDAVFSGEANFRHCVFKGGAKFNNAVFNGDADFAKAFFKGHTNFSATFGGKAVFFDATFEHKVKFNNSVIVGHADFEYTSFMMESEFQKTEFHGGASFLIEGGPHVSSGYPFKGNANFTEAYFAKTATFADRYFDGDMIFTGAIFEGSAYFEDGRTRGVSKFDGAYFVDSTRFSNHVFGSSSTFDNACFATRKSHEFFSINVQNLPLGSVPKSPGNSWPQNQIPIGSRYGESWDFEKRTFKNKSPQAT